MEISVGVVPYVRRIQRIRRILGKLNNTLKDIKKRIKGLKNALKVLNI